MGMRKYIYWRNDCPSKDGKSFVNVHLLVGYNQATITDFQGMAAELRKTFPEAKDDEIGCGKIHKSSCVDGFSIIRWSTYLSYGTSYEGWISVDGGDMEYCW